MLAWTSFSPECPSQTSLQSAYTLVRCTSYLSRLIVYKGSSSRELNTPLPRLACSASNRSASSSSKSAIGSPSSGGVAALLAKFQGPSPTDLQDKSSREREERLRVLDRSVSVSKRVSSGPWGQTRAPPEDDASETGSPRLGVRDWRAETSGGLKRPVTERRVSHELERLLGAKVGGRSASISSNASSTGTSPTLPSSSVGAFTPEEPSGTHHQRPKKLSVGPPAGLEGMLKLGPTPPPSSPGSSPAVVVSDLPVEESDAPQEEKGHVEKVLGAEVDVSHPIPGSKETANDDEANANANVQVIPPTPLESTHPPIPSPTTSKPVSSPPSPPPPVDSRLVAELPLEESPSPPLTDRPPTRPTPAAGPLEPVTPSQPTSDEPTTTRFSSSPPPLPKDSAYSSGTPFKPPARSRGTPSVASPSRRPQPSSSPKSSHFATPIGGRSRTPRPSQDGELESPGYMRPTSAFSHRAGSPSTPASSASRSTDGTKPTLSRPRSSLARSTPPTTTTTTAGTPVRSRSRASGGPVKTHPDGSPASTSKRLGGGGTTSSRLYSPTASTLAKSKPKVTPSSSPSSAARGRPSPSRVPAGQGKGRSARESVGPSAYRGLGTEEEGGGEGEEGEGRKVRG